MQSRQANEAADCSILPSNLVHVFLNLRGWIYFERLVSTIRVALTDEQYAAEASDHRMLLQYLPPSNSLQHVSRGSYRLRKCAGLEGVIWTASSIQEPFHFAGASIVEPR